MGCSRQQAKTQIVAGAIAAALFFGLTAAAGAQGAVRSVHGDWQIRCDTPPGGGKCRTIRPDKRPLGSDRKYIPVLGPDR